MLYNEGRPNYPKPGARSSAFFFLIVSSFKRKIRSGSFFPFISGVVPFLSPLELSGSK